MASEVAMPGGDAAYRRRVTNYLLDRRFQLKYSAYFVGIALTLGLSLGSVLFRVSKTLIGQCQEVVVQSERAAARGRDVVAESRKVTEVVKMNILDDPVYRDNHALIDAFRIDAERQEEKLRDQQQALELQSQSLAKQSQAIVAGQRTLMLTLFSTLALLIVLIGFAGIVVTHRVAGPIFKMKRQIQEVTAGRLKVPERLRKGDDLGDFFDAFAHMVHSLRQRQQEAAELLHRGLAPLRQRVEREELEPFEELERRMRVSIRP
jgi:nitrogen fixation/metabolism regulation signal transduction histidine kinase